MWPSFTSSQRVCSPGALYSFLAATRQNTEKLGVPREGLACFRKAKASETCPLRTEDSGLQEGCPQACEGCHRQKVKEFSAAPEVSAWLEGHGWCPRDMDFLIESSKRDHTVSGESRVLSPTLSDAEWTDWCSAKASSWMTGRSKQSLTIMCLRKCVRACLCVHVWACVWLCISYTENRGWNGGSFGVLIIWVL